MSKEKSEVGGQRSEVGKQRSEVGDQRSAAGAAGAISGKALEACPFCGAAARVGNNTPEWWTICGSCGAATAVYENEADAVTAWNRRAGVKSERDMLGEVIRRLKQRGVIPHDFVFVNNPEGPR